MAGCLRAVKQMISPVWGSRLPCLPPSRALCSATTRSSDTPAEPSGAVDSPEGSPHMLHAVWRIRSLKRRPYWERNIMKQLMLERMNHPVVHKNTPSVNTLLQQVRHLVRIKPVVLKQGLPNGDYDSTLLKWNGEFLVRRRLDSVGKEIEAGPGSPESHGRTGELSSK